VADRAEQAERGDDRGQRQHQRHERGDDRPEREEQHEERHGEREHLGPVQVAVGVVASAAGAVAADRDLRVRTRCGVE
jgi:hypothetical protein